MRPSYLIKVDKDGSNMLPFLCKMIEEEVLQYDLRIPMVDSFDYLNRIGTNNESQIKQTTIAEIDGAMIIDPNDPKTEIWDTSSVMVFDGLVDDTLREKLLDIVVGRYSDKNTWDDISYGPDPKRWMRGGLSDTFDDDDADNEEQTSCWGLSEEAINELCFSQHPPIIEFEEKLQKMFPGYMISRLPEAFLGENVSPLTANAPTFGDTFSYHIDADPNLAPPSPWTDIFGRYYNRLNGRPRFVSCLLYLNESWDDEFGAPTRFYDPPTGETFDIIPKPGRCIIMDQDITHTVVAPSQSAGARPRYSLVWKLVFHPRQRGQSMKDGVGESNTKLIGSAKRCD